MPRNDGTNYTVARNRDLVGSDVGKAQAHNEREKDYYSNLDAMCEDLDIDKAEITAKLERINYHYNAELNKFV